MPEEEGDLDLLAAEYALGALDGAERQTVERRRLDSPELARRITDWEQRLAPLSEDLPPVTPSPQVWQRVRRTIAARSRGPAVARQRWWQRLGLWRAWSATATAAAAVLALLLLVPSEPEQLIAVMSDPGGRPLWVVRAGGAGSAVQARPVDGAGSADQVPQLWLARTEGPPLPLGLLERGGGRLQTLTLPPGARLEAGATLAISLEPLGGSPTGAPTGPVVSHGVLLAEP